MVNKIDIILPSWSQSEPGRNALNVLVSLDVVCVIKEKCQVPQNLIFPVGVVPAENGICASNCAEI